jgi:hypothetical protein
MIRTQKNLLALLAVMTLSVTPALVCARQATSQQEGVNLMAIANKSDTLKSGNFENVKAKTRGSVSLIKANNGRHFLVFSSNFRSEDGPDLFVVLGNEELKEGEIAAGERPYTVSPLLRLKGEQRYILPGDLDISQFSTVGIWCRQMNMVLGVATLK